MAPLLLAALLQSQAPTGPPFVPRASGWVRDEAGVLSDATEERLNGILAGHQRATSNQVVVLTVASLDGDVVESVALRRASELKVGRDDIDNGVLLLVAPNERKVRIEVGYGLEGVLPDARCVQIIRAEILPRFKAGDLDGGVEHGVRAVLGAIQGAYTPSKKPAPVERFPPALDFQGQFMLGLFGGLLLAPIGQRLFRIDDRSFRWVRAGLATLLPGGVVAAFYPIALLGFGLAALIYLMKDIDPTGGDGYSYGHSGGSWSSDSSSSSSGDSFSGGGGDFGGGGASGSW
ncbi:MAG TPA: TPM domain-containing protein [Vicinamibacteria bacterium]|nr:TPM domain-containing protein [Vicinamibacteria bacterium]